MNKSFIRTLESFHSLTTKLEQVSQAISVCKEMNTNISKKIAITNLSKEMNDPNLTHDNRHKHTPSLMLPLGLNSQSMI